MESIENSHIGGYTESYWDKDPDGASVTSSGKSISDLIYVGEKVTKKNSDQV